MQNIKILEDFFRTRRNNLERRKEQIAEEDKQQEALENFLQQYKKMSEQLEALTLERDALKNENERLRMEQKELSKMSQKLVEKTEHNSVIKVFRKYMNLSKRKNVQKRSYIKVVITEIVQSVRLTLPEDMLQELESFDDDNIIDRPTIGEYVAVKHVENEIQNVEAGGTGVAQHLNACDNGY